jgi:FkbM family methyltransferase
MSQLVSYAQNFEDVILRRALAGVEQGNYIDIGAQSALVDSVSRMFYDLGWHGVHVEPVNVYADELVAARPGDQVLRVAVGEERGTITFHEFPSTGLSTIDAGIAAGHRQEGFDIIERLTPLVTLDDVFSEANFDQVHWLKIDVEGFEASVIRGWRGEARPWVLVVESTLPLSQVETYDAWESMLLAKGYTFAYFDGLNRFYVSAEHRDLLRSFGPGPNVFDDFSLSGIASQPFTRLLKGAVSDREAEIERISALYADFRRGAEADAALAREDALQSRRAFDLLNGQAVQLAGEVRQHRESAYYWWVVAEQMREELGTIKSSRSWRLTAPIRQFRAGHFTVGTLTKKIARGVLARVMIRVIRRPAVVRWMQKLLSLTPSLKAWLRNIGVAYGFIDQGVGQVSGFSGQAAAAHRALSLKASRVLQDIDAAMKGEGT